jgi:hypothetical protein
VQVTLVSLLSALCDAEVLSSDELQTVGLWLVESGFLEGLEENPNGSQVRKLILPALDDSKPSVGYLRVPLWTSAQVTALGLEGKVISMEAIEVQFPPSNPEVN